jgi:hypothetical protein
MQNMPQNSSATGSIAALRDKGRDLKQFTDIAGLPEIQRGSRSATASLTTNSAQKLK